MSTPVPCPDAGSDRASLEREPPGLRPALQIGHLEPAGGTLLELGEQRQRVVWGHEHQPLTGTHAIECAEDGRVTHGVWDLPRVELGMGGAVGLTAAAGVAGAPATAFGG